MTETAEIKRFTLRLSQNIFDFFKSEAARNHRATGKEIEHILEKVMNEREYKRGKEQC